MTQGVPSQAFVHADRAALMKPGLLADCDAPEGVITPKALHALHRDDGAVAWLAARRHL